MMVDIKCDRLISHYTIDEYCNRLVNKVYNILCLKEEHKDYQNAIVKIIEEMNGATISGIKPFLDNYNVLEIVFIISGLSREMKYSQFRTIILDCCTLINQLPERLCRGEESK